MRDVTGRTVPRWGAAGARRPWTVGVEDEALLLHPGSGAPANDVEHLLEVLPDHLARSATAETHACVLELRTAPHATVEGVVSELATLRTALDDVVSTRLGLRVGAAGTHPVAQPGDVRLARTPRYREVARTTRALARREPTLALHIHVGVPDPGAAVRALDGLRGDLPLLLALSANSPFAAGQDTGFASYRTPLFSAFPRVGIPRAFGTFDAYAGTVGALVAGGAIPDESFVWWDARLRPALGTVEVRVMDAQSRVDDIAALAALVQCLVRQYAEGAPGADPRPPEVLAENRFAAARDGVRAELIGAVGGRLLAGAAALPGHARQRRIAERHGPAAIAPALATEFAPRARAGAAAYA